MENYNIENITEKITEENKIYTLEVEFNSACMTMTQVNIPPRLLANFYELFIKAVKAKLNVDYYTYGTRLIFHATRLGIVNDDLKKLAKALLQYGKLLSRPGYKVLEDFNLLYDVYDGKIMKNPYIGPDGKDTLVYPDKDTYVGR